MKLMFENEKRPLAPDEAQVTQPNGFTRFGRKSKSNTVLSFMCALTIFMLAFFLVFRAIDVLPRKINIFWISEDSLSSLKINITICNEVSQKSTSIGKSCDVLPDIDKFDCYPESNSNEKDCLSRGCCWKALGIQRPTPNVPYCYYPSAYLGYQITSRTDRSDGFSVSLLRNQSSGFPKDIVNVTVNVTFLDNNRLRVKIFDSVNKRYEVPLPKIKDLSDSVISNRNYDVKIEDIYLSIIRTSTGTVVFNTSLSTLVFADQMLQISIKLPSHYVYGIGENKDGLLRGTDWKRYVLFARDRVPEANMNLYGSQPFYLVMENDGNSHGIFLLNSNPMEVVLQPTPAITFRPIGGILDFYVSMGPSPGDVISQYTDLIGRSFMPPYWSLGFHLCRLGYNSVNKTREVWKRTLENGIPFDTQWNDIDHMDKYNDFTINQTTFSDLPQFVEDLHEVGMHYIMIVDPGISNAEPPGTYGPYDDGVDMDIFIKNTTGQLQIGKVWNRISTVFPDFTNPKSVAYWTKQLNDFHKIVPFDGVWIDMNEPSNFVDGSIYGCPEDSLENPPFVPGGFEPLRSKTLCMTSKQYASVHYDVHNIHGLTEMAATNSALKSVLNKRPFIISRSTFPGSGHYGGHWDGDVYSTWDHMRWTISSILTQNMMGISMSGADICGFNGNTTVELCARWSALGAFYPFSRNHNSDDTIEQDPVALGEEVIISARNMLSFRYVMLPLLYTLFYRSHVYGETVMRPIFFEFPNDKKTYGLDRQFMWGRDIMIIPALDEGRMEVTGYIPKGRWISFNGTKITSKGDNVSLYTPLNSTNIFLREGAILLTQPSMKTSLIGQFSIFVFMNETGRAVGQLYWDDGDTIDSYEKGLFTLIDFSVGNNTFKSTATKTGFQDNLIVIFISINSVNQEPKSVQLNGLEISFIYEAESIRVNREWSLLEDIVISWSY